MLYLSHLRTRFTFQLIKLNGGGAYTHSTGRPVRFDCYCSSGGFPQFIKRNELQGVHLGVLSDNDDSIRE
jgi:hypothetical protein